MPYTILHINSSPAAERSVSRKLTANVLAELQAKHPDSKVIERDLASNPFPHLTGLTVGAFYTPPEQRNEALSEAIKLSDQAVDEVLAADSIIIGAPMHNFAIPSSLKAWIDHIVRVGRTFGFGPSGPVGLVSSGKKVIVVSARGGVYSAGPMKALDYQETYLRTVLEFIGLKDIAIVRAEGVAMRPDGASEAMKAAEAQLTAVMRNAA
jgi:FMN-dependent NADH-azoreductase